MRRGKLRSLALLLVLMMFAAGLAIFLYPYLWGAMVDREISLNAQGFPASMTIRNPAFGFQTMVLGMKCSE